MPADLFVLHLPEYLLQDPSVGLLLNRLQISYKLVSFSLHPSSQSISVLGGLFLQKAVGRVAHSRDPEVLV